MKNCKICGEKTENIFNINFNEILICEDCATSILFKQAKRIAIEKENRQKREALLDCPICGLPIPDCQTRGKATKEHIEMYSSITKKL